MRSGPPPTPRAIFPKLFLQAATCFESLSSADKSTVMSCRMLFNHVPKLPSIEVWTIIMGFPTSVLAAARSIYPCGEMVDALGSSTTNSPVCGDAAYCTNCSILLHHLGESWHFHTTVNFVGGLCQKFLWFRFQAEHNLGTGFSTLCQV